MLAVVLADNPWLMSVATTLASKYGMPVLEWAGGKVKSLIEHWVDKRVSQPQEVQKPI